MHPISRPCFCGLRLPIGKWARSDPRRRPAIWGTWPPNPSPPIGINHLASTEVSTAFAVALTTFLASTVEAIEMVAIVAGVGATRGWRASLLGAAGAVLVLVLVAAAAVFGVGLTAIPIEVLRLVVGAVLLVFGLNWLRKGIRRVAASGLQGYRGHLPEVDEDVHEGRVDWTGFVLSFKGVLLEGLEVAFIVVTFGGAEEYGGQVAGVLDALPEVPPAPGSAGVLVPGDPERRTRAARMRDGIAVPEATWDELTAIGRRFGVPMPARR